MSTLYVTQQDTVLRKTDERLKVTQQGATLLDVPMLKVEQVVIFGRVTVTAPTLQSLLEHHIPVCYLSEHGRSYTSYKVANMLLEFSTSIARTQLQPGYGDGFFGAPLQVGWLSEHSGPQLRGGRRGTSKTSRQDNTGDSHHV